MSDDLILKAENDEASTKEAQPTPDDVVKQQEQLLSAKYPGIKGAAGGSALLQRRLHKGQKYFDSGDYNVAKAKLGEHHRQAPPLAVTTEKVLLQQSTGDEIPTPANLPRPLLVPSKLTTAAADAQ